MRYYLPGLDVSAMSDEEFAQRMASLLQIRKMERAEQMEQTIKNLFNG
jgi:K+/H+ antiporter YhaU regulatory subunit KhtT